MSQGTTLQLAEKLIAHSLLSQGTTLVAPQVAQNQSGL